MGIFNFLKIAFYVVTTVVGVKNYKAAKKLQDQGQDILATKTAQGGKIPIIYGRRRVGSTLLYMDTDSGNSKELFVIYGLCLGEVDSIELDTIEINGVPLSDTKVFRDGYYTGSDKISSGAGSLNTVSQIGTSSGSFRGDGRSGTDPTKIYRMVLNAHHGSDDQAVDPMLNQSQPAKFTSNHRLRGIAYIAASFQYDEKGMFTSVPELTVVVKGRKLYDPRLDGSITGGTGSHRIDDPTTYEWSNNAALTMLDYMHQDYGKGLATSSIDLQSFQTAANTADTIVDVPDYSGSYASATFSADVEDNFITVNEATWKKIKGGELLSVKDSGGSVIINQNNVIDAQRFTPHTESTNFRIYIDGVPPAKVSKSVTFSATNGDATITVSCTSHGASANDRVLFAGATSLGGNITATVLNKGYTIATVVDANSFTIEATDLNLTTVLANSSDTGNGGGSAVGKFMYADESGLFLAQTRRLQCDGVLDTNETVLDNARDLLSNMRGFLNYIDGKYSVLVEDATSSSFSITDDHIIDQGIKIRYEDKAEKLNKVVVQFFNAQKKYESDTKTVFHNNSTSTYKNDDGGEELETTAEFQYITNPYNAFNMGKGILERSRRQKTVSFIGTPRLLNLTAGDVVSITYTPYNLSNAAYRIETINLLDNGLVGIQAIEYFDLYTWSSTPPEENVGADPDLPTGTEAEPPTNLTFTDATSTRRAFLTWTAATNYPAKEFRVIIKNSSGQEIHNRIVSDAFIDLDFIAVANGYVASITSISSTGAESSATSITFNVTQQPVKLGDIQANAITADEINVTDLAAISADLGSITAGSINIGSGAFTVSSSGVMTATGATVSGAITASSLNVTGATVTGTIDASKITLNGDPLTDIFALASDTEGENILLKESGTSYGSLIKSGSNFKIKSMVNNGDIKLSGIDGGVPRDALTLDMSLQGAATFHSTQPAEFNGALTVGGAITVFQNVLTSTNALKLNSGQSSITLFNTNTFDAIYEAGNHIFKDASGSNERFRITGTGLIGLGGANYGTSGQVLTSNGSSTPPTWQSTGNVVASYSNGVDNRLVTSTGAAGINGESNLTFDGSTLNVTGNIIVSNDLSVQGTTTTIDTTNLDVKDKNITLNFSTGDSSANANGAGITIQDAVSQGNDATILWDNTNDEFDFSHGITLPDSQKLQFGAGNDLQIFHTGNSSIIKDSGTGSLSVRGTHLNLADAAGNIFIDMTDTGTGGTVEIKHNASTKLTTTSTGIDVTGIITTDGLTTSADINFGDNDKAVFGAGSDYKIYHNGNTSFVENNTGSLFITNSSDDFDVVIQSDDGSGSLADYFRADGSAGSAKLYHYGSQKLATTSTGVTVTGTLTATTLAGTLSTAAQPNITSVGTLTSLSSGVISIGTDTGDPFNPNAKIKIQDSGTAYIQIKTGTSNFGGLLVGDTADDFAGGFIYDNNGDVLRLYSNDNVSLELDDNYDVNVFQGALKIGGTEVITSARNLTNIGTISSGAITSSAVQTFTKSVYGDFDSENFYRIKFQDQGGVHNDVGIGQFQSGALGFNVTQGQEFRFNEGTDGVVGVIGANGVDARQGGFRIGTTTVIDSSRNLTNIGTISSGAITSTGYITSSNVKIGVWAANSNFSGLFQTSHGSTGYSLIANATDTFIGSGTSGTTHIRYNNNTSTNQLKVNSSGWSMGETVVMDGSRNLTNIGTISSGAITSTGASSGRYTGLEVVNSTNAGGTETAIGLGVVSASNTSCDVKLVANRIGANFGSDFYIEQTDSSGSQQETFRISESGNATFAGEIFLGNQKEINFAKSDGTNDGTKIERFGGNALRFRYTGNSCIFDSLGNNPFSIRNSNDSVIFEVAPNSTHANSTTNINNGVLQIAGTTVINGSRNLVNIGTISSGDIISTGILRSNKTSFPQLQLQDASNSVQIGHSGNNFFIKRGDNDGQIRFRNIDNTDPFIFDLTTATPVFTTTGTISSGAISSTGNSTFRGSGANSTNAFKVERASDNAIALRIQNSGEVVVENNYLYASHSGTSFYVQGGAVFRGGISNDTSGQPVTFNDDISVSGGFNATSAGSIPSIRGGGSYGGGIGFVDTNVSGMYTDGSGANLRLFTNQSGSDRADAKIGLSIDGSQNVLIGGTSAFANNATTINSSGLVYASRAGNKAGHFNLQSSDGDIVVFSKDGTTIGSIGTQSGQLFIGNEDGSTDTGLLFGESGTSARSIIPARADGSVVDAALDLGYSSGRFKDLHLSGTISSGNITATLINVGNSSGTGTLRADGTHTRVGSTSNHPLRFLTNNTNRAEITTAGVFNCANDVAAFGTLSDITLKENIQVIENPLDKVKQIRGVNFSYKKDGRKSTGLIAQELEKVLPNAIFTTNEINDDKEIKAIRYGNVVGLLVEAIKEQQEQIDELKAKLDDCA